MIKKILKSSFVQGILSYCLAGYIWAVFKTSRWKMIGFHLPADYTVRSRPFLTCFWHGRLTMLPYAWPFKEPFYMLISFHKDGKLISKTVGHLGIQTIAGSTSKGGTEALREILKTFKKGHTVGITPDGPRGPLHTISDGTIIMAKLGQVDILPVTFTTTRGKILKSWDQFYIPFPFSKGVIIWGAPITVGKNDDTNFIKNQVRDALCRLSQQAEESLRC